MDMYILTIKIGYEYTTKDNSNSKTELTAIISKTKNKYPTLPNMYSIHTTMASVRRNIKRAVDQFRKKHNTDVIITYELIYT